MSGSGAGSKIVRKTLADGTVKEYRYDRARRILRTPAPEKGAVEQIAHAYYQSPEFRQLSQGWQKATRYYVGLIIGQLGWMSFSDLAKREARTEFFDLRDKHADYPAKADKLMNVLRALLSFAYDRAKLSANHAIQIPKLVPANHSRAEHIWKPDLLQQFFTGATPCLRRLMLMALYTGARQSDLCALNWSDIQDGWLVYQPAKTMHSTRVWVTLPTFALDPLAELIASLPRPANGQDGPLLMTDGGHIAEKYKLPRKWRHENIKKHMLYARARSHMEDADLRFHDIRGTTETSLLEAGCSEAEANAVLGHVLVSGSGARNYAARSRKLALNAYRRWNAAMRGEAEIISLARL